jgi:hypothetical protein
MTENQNTDSTYETWLSKHGGYANSMTMRDYFAAKAMQPILMAGGVINTSTFEEDAHTAYEMADAMLKARGQ